MFNWLKALNPKTWIVNSLKNAAIGIVNSEADVLAGELKAAIAKDGPGAIDRTIDAAQARIIAAVKTKGPTWAFLEPIRAQVADAIQGFGDDLQGKLDAAVKDNAGTAVDLVFAQAKAILLARLQAIAI